MTKKISEISEELYHLRLDQNIQGFRSFIGSWFYKSGKNILIDPGPAYTIPVLIQILDELQIKRLDFILLTHIHIDHAGGTGHLIRRFPNTPVILHKSGIKHLADPEKLWQGSLKTLKETAEAYGKIAPVPSELLIDSDSFDSSQVKVISTPGHAVHHISFLIEEYLFAGEAGGVFKQLSDKNYYLRPATPPRFFLETSIKSIDSLLQIPHKLLCYGHFGVAQQTPELLKKHKQQLLMWADILSEQVRTGAAGEEKCIEILLEKDPLLYGWKDFKVEEQERELIFLRNSVRGFLQYLMN